MQVLRVLLHEKVRSNLKICKFLSAKQCTNVNQRPKPNASSCGQFAGDHYSLSFLGFTLVDDVPDGFFRVASQVFCFLVVDVVGVTQLVLVHVPVLQKVENVRRLKTHRHRRRIGIRPKRSKRIAIEERN